MYRSGDTCYLEPYVPSRFARQFGYDQLYVGNPNTSLAFMGSLIGGARTWWFYIAGCTEARLCMPLRSPNLQTILGFYQWYRTSNFTPIGFSINSFGMKLISRRLKRKVTERGEGKSVRVPGLGEFVATTDSEASMQRVPVLRETQVLRFHLMLLVG